MRISVVLRFVRAAVAIVQIVLELTRMQLEPGPAAAIQAGQDLQAHPYTVGARVAHDEACSGVVDHDVLTPVPGTAALQQLDLVIALGLQAFAVLDFVDHSVCDDSVRSHGCALSYAMSGAVARRRSSAR